MFTFGFSGENTPVEAATDCKKLIWEPSRELCLDQIKPYFEAIDKETNIARLKIGNVEVGHVTVSKAVSEAVKKGLENIKRAEENNSDLIPSVYEGGLKIWECTLDLAEYVTSLKIDWLGKNVLDLGCGAGFLGILAASQGARVVFQDYNSEVLLTFTGPNVLLNNAEASNTTFYSGDWSSFLKYYCSKHKDSKFDFILTSETIYNPENYEKLHDVISGLLKTSGTCFLAAKSVYFGVGGSTQNFINFVRQHGKLQSKLCFSTSDGIAREIYNITHKPPLADDAQTGQPT